jgi:hypothetical protein
VTVRLDLLPGVAHSRFAALESAKDFLAEALKNKRSAAR